MDWRNSAKARKNHLEVFWEDLPEGACSKNGIVLPKSQKNPRSRFLLNERNALEDRKKCPQYKAPKLFQDFDWRYAKTRKLGRFKKIKLASEEVKSNLKGIVLVKQESM